MKKNNDTPELKIAKKASFAKRFAGRVFGTFAGPCVAVAEAHVFQFDVPIQETIENDGNAKLLILLNGLLITGILNPIVTYHNVIRYYKDAVNAGKQHGPGAVKDSFEFLQLPVSTMFKPTLSGIEERCAALKSDMNNHHRPDRPK